MTSVRFLGGLALSVALCLGALCLGALLRASDGQAASSEALPAGVAACAFDALANDPQSAGLAIHDAPRDDAPVLGRLPPSGMPMQAPMAGMEKFPKFMSSVPGT